MLSFWLISTETVKSTGKVGCEGLTAVIRRKLGATGRLRHGAMKVWRTAVVIPWISLRCRFHPFFFRWR